MDREKIFVGRITEELKEAFEQLVKRLMWYETRGKHFHMGSFTVWDQAYPEHSEVLQRAGMNFNNLGVFVLEVMKAEGSGRWDYIRERTPVGQSDWMLLMRRTDGKEDGFEDMSDVDLEDDFYDSFENFGNHQIIGQGVPAPQQRQVAQTHVTDGQRAQIDEQPTRVEEQPTQSEVRHAQYDFQQPQQSAPIEDFVREQVRVKLGLENQIRALEEKVRENDERERIRIQSNEAAMLVERDRAIRDSVFREQEIEYKRIYGVSKENITKATMVKAPENGIKKNANYTQACTSETAQQRDNQKKEKVINNKITRAKVKMSRSSESSDPSSSSDSDSSSESSGSSESTSGSSSDSDNIWRSSHKKKLAKKNSSKRKDTKLRSEGDMNLSGEDRKFDRLIGALQLNSTAGEDAIAPLNDKNKNPKKWFRNFDKKARSRGWSKSVKAVKLIQFLKGEAEGIWQSMSHKTQEDYEKVKKRIIKKLTPEDAVEIAKREFSSAAQRNDESANNFGRRLKKLAKDARIDQEKEVVSHFLKHLLPNTSRQLVTYSTKSMEKAMSKAKRCEDRLELLEEIQRESINSVTNKKLIPAIKPYHTTPPIPQTTPAPETTQQSNFGNQAQQPRYQGYPQASVQQRLDIPNINHQMYGTSMYQPSPMTNQRNNWTKPTSNSFDKSQITCYGCNKQGHFRRDCNTVCGLCQGMGHAEHNCKTKREVSFQKN